MMPVDGALLQACFPPELEREIFEIAVLSYPSALPAVLRVARRVQHWIEPLTFRVLCLNRSAKAKAFVKTLRRLKKLEPPQTKRITSGIRHLFFDLRGLCTVEETKDILRACNNLYDFAAIGDFSHPGLLPILANLRITRLAICFEVLFGGLAEVDLMHPTLLGITHLDVFDPVSSLIGPNQVSLDELLPQLPSLTHLCLNNENPNERIFRLLKNCPHLKLLVVLAPGRTDQINFDPSDPRENKDDRLVYGTFGDYWAQWESGAHGSPNFWTIAENVVARRHQERSKDMALNSLRPVGLAEAPRYIDIYGPISPAPTSLAASTADPKTASPVSSGTQILLASHDSASFGDFRLQVPAGDGILTDSLQDIYRTFTDKYLLDSQLQGDHTYA
ncbi:hypothetical protein MIND_01265600 [Mycena indigotica]|uniref:Uncharacterized protein n=1 Tax=Mycena indigotica TaxID=2126181 RepID=A0A8H6S375_9AGAR|nr:uncharacterized protein MIND_01265600 [Mycena indigotica]KAF7291221.1 hypothetical protein MIND_01265600 [Mycena indigotica]